MKIIWKFETTKEKWITVGIMVSILLQVLLETAIPAQMANISTLLQMNGSEISSIVEAGLKMSLYAVLAFLISLLSSYLLAGICASVCSKIRKAMYEKIIDFSMTETQYFGTGSLITRCTNDIATIENFFNSCMKPMVQAPLSAAIVILRIATGEPLWTLMAIMAMVVILAVVICIFIKVIPMVKKLSAYNDKLSTLTKEHVSGIRVVHAYNAFEKQENEYEETNNAFVKLNIKQEGWLALFAPVTSFVLYGLSVAIYVSGAFVIKDMAGTDRLVYYSNMASFVSYISMLIVAFVNLVSVVLLFPLTNNASKRITEVLSTIVSIKDADNAVEDNDELNEGTIEFKNVGFKYVNSEDYVLENITFKVNKGETLAIIGGTGCGKTSILNLIPRLCDVTKGEVLVDGKNVKDYKLSDLRNRIGYVPQKSFLFAGNIISNIGYGENGRFNLVVDKVIEAAKIGQADDFINSKEGGYNSEVMLGGSNFSGGQKQRLTISRAIYRDPEIYIFDDSFSALDFKTDKTLRDALKEYSKDKTTIIVGQRIGTIQDADRILVIDKGHIVGQGTHTDLMNNCEVYKEIALSQLSSEEAM